LGGAGGGFGPGTVGAPGPLWFSCVLWDLDRTKENSDRNSSESVGLNAS
jgi:hypothetical protein